MTKHFELTKGSKKGTRETFSYLMSRQAAGWPGSISIHRRPLKRSGGSR